MIAAERMRTAEATLEKAEEPYRQKIEELRPYIETNALEVGQTFEYAGFKVSHRSGYERVSLPKGNLDSIRDGKPDLYRQIQPYLKVSEVKPTAKLEI